MLDFMNYGGNSSPMLDAMRMGNSSRANDPRYVGELDIRQPELPQQVPQEQAGMLDPSQQQPQFQPPMQQAQPQQQQGGGMQGWLSDPNNSKMLLAMAGGMGSGRTPLAGLGGAFSAASDELTNQDKMKQQHELAMSALQQKRDTLTEAKRINDSKILGYAAKAAKDGMPKKIGSSGGQTTLAWPDGSITSNTDDEVQRIYDTAEKAKTERAAIVAGIKGDLAPLPSQVLKDNNDSKDAITAINGMNSVFDTTERDLTNGNLNLGLFTNLLSAGKNYTGNSDAESQAFNNFKGNIEGLRNSYLALQKGMQTEGDAQRAMSQLMSSLNDPGVVKVRMAELRDLNRKALIEHQQRITNNYSESGKEAPGFDPNTNLPVFKTVTSKTAQAKVLSGGIPAIPNNPTIVEPEAPFAVDKLTQAQQAGLQKLDPVAWNNTMSKLGRPGLAAAQAAPQTKQQPLPMPASPTVANLIPNKVYMTAKGPALWTGTNFKSD